MTGEVEYTHSFQSFDGQSRTVEWVKQLIFAFFSVVMVILVCNFIISVTMNDLQKIRPLAIATQCRNILADIIDDKHNHEAFCGKICFEMVVEKKCYLLFSEKDIETTAEWQQLLNQFYNKIWRYWNEIKLEYSLISLWVYDDTTESKKKLATSGKRLHKMVPGGLVPIDTVQGLLKDYEERKLTT